MIDDHHDTHGFSELRLAVIGALDTSGWSGAMEALAGPKPAYTYALSRMGSREQLNPRNLPAMYCSAYGDFVEPGIVLVPLVSFNSNVELTTRDRKAHGLDQPYETSSTGREKNSRVYYSISCFHPQ